MNADDARLFYEKDEALADKYRRRALDKLPTSEQLIADPDIRKCSQDIEYSIVTRHARGVIEEARQTILEISEWPNGMWAEDIASIRFLVNQLADKLGDPNE